MLTWYTSPLHIVHCISPIDHDTCCGWVTVVTCMCEGLCQCKHCTQPVLVQWLYKWLRCSPSEESLCFHPELPLGLHGQQTLLVPSASYAALTGRSMSLSAIAGCPLRRTVASPPRGQGELGLRKPLCSWAPAKSWLPQSAVQ